MNLVQAAEDTVTCISFYAQGATSELRNILRLHPSYIKKRSVRHYADQEDMYGLTILNELIEMSKVKSFNVLPETCAQLLEIKKAMDLQGAAFFRFIVM